jgi:hypothetical protein
LRAPGLRRGCRAEWGTAPTVGPVTDDELPALRLLRWNGPWADDDPDATFKAEVADYSRLDPFVTLQGMSDNLGIPVGALARYVLARWATAGSGGLLELGPTMVHRLWEPVARAEAAGTDGARLAAYAELRGLLSWLKVPLDDPAVYDDGGNEAPAG